MQENSAGEINRDTFHQVHINIITACIHSMDSFLRKKNGASGCVVDVTFVCVLNDKTSA